MAQAKLQVLSLGTFKSKSHIMTAPTLNSQAYQGFLENARIGRLLTNTHSRSWVRIRTITLPLQHHWTLTRPSPNVTLLSARKIRCLRASAGGVAERAAYVLDKIADIVASLQQSDFRLNSVSVRLQRSTLE
jgi:hypothetical protein